MQKFPLTEEKWSQVQTSLTKEWTYETDQLLYQMIEKETSYQNVSKRFPIDVNWKKIGEQLDKHPIDCIQRFACIFDTYKERNHEENQQYSSQEEFQREEEEEEEENSLPCSPVSESCSNEALSPPPFAIPHKFGKPFFSSFMVGFPPAGGTNEEEIKEETRGSLQNQSMQNSGIALENNACNERDSSGEENTITMSALEEAFLDLAGSKIHGSTIPSVFLRPKGAQRDQ